MHVRNKAVSEFRAAMKAHHLEIRGELLADGEWHRCDAVNKENGHGKNDGAYVLHLDGIVPRGTFINYTTGRAKPTSWVYKRDRPPTDAELRQIKAELARERQAYQADREQMRAEAKEVAKQRCDRAEPASRLHPYCRRKGVRPDGLRMEGRNGPLLVPMLDEHRKRVNLQFIYPDGHKHCIKGGPGTDCHYWITKPDEVESNVICIAEGWATGKSAFDATTHAVIMTFGKNNLMSVAKWVRRRYPKHTIILLADVDEDDGIAKATDAARAVSGLIAIPEFGSNRRKDDKDFNDLARVAGLDEVRRLIDDAVEPDQDYSQPTGVVHDLPVIRVEDGQIARIVDEAQDALIKSGLPIFINSGRLVFPTTVDREAADGSKTRSTVMSSTDERKIAYYLNKRAAVFNKFDRRREAWVSTNPPPQVAATLLSLKEWKFPEVVGLVGAPTMRPDGSILNRYGYDPPTRLWCYADMALSEIPERPTRQQAMTALRLFKELLAEYPFRSEIDMAVALAATLTVILRGAFDLTPMFLLTAHDSGTGKSHLVDLLSTLASGRCCPVITAGKHKEEMEKRLGSVLLEGGSMISLDNMSFDLESDLLCQILTQKIVKVRILGKSEVPECEWKGTIFATGNNVRVLGDLVRRTLTCQLDAGVERPELREFSFDPIARVHGDRDSYIAAAITIARAYRAVGRDAPSIRPLAGYASWSATVREPLLWLGEHDPVKSMEAARAADPARAAAYELVTRWQQLFGLGKAVSVRDIVAIANETKNTAGTPRYPKFRALLLEHAGTMKHDAVDPVRLGRWLQHQHGRVYGALRIDLVQHKGKPNEYVLTEIEDNGLC